MNSVFWKSTENIQIKFWGQMITKFLLLQSQRKTVVSEKIALTVF